jgi:hypothetical protein
MSAINTCVSFEGSFKAGGVLKGAPSSRAIALTAVCVHLERKTFYERRRKECLISNFKAPSTCSGGDGITH